MKKILLLVCILLCMGISAYAAETTYSGVCDPIVIDQPGEHTIILNGVTINGVDEYYSDEYESYWISYPAIKVEAPATKLTIVLKDGTINTIMGSSTTAGIDNNKKDIVICCESAGEGHQCTDTCGKLFVTGGSSSAGIGSSGNGYKSFDGTITLNGGNITATGGRLAAGIGGSEGVEFAGAVIINGGNITANGGDVGSSGIGNASMSTRMSGSITINGGVVNASHIGSAYDTDKMTGIIVISGGVVNANSIGCIGIYGCTIKISGGTVTAGSICGSRVEDGGHHENDGITISGGSVHADVIVCGGGKGVNISDGIVNASNIVGETIVISGGFVTANDSNGRIAIEGDYITIDGGTVIAIGGIGRPGIGILDEWNALAKIVINGGNITATGGAYGGAGIGVDVAADMNSTIIINGGIVKAIGNGGGAGIGGNGGDSMTAGGNVTITGGTVTAIGGERAAGIGAGEGGDFAGKVIMKGDVDVTAIGGCQGIGPGYNGSFGEDAEIYVEPVNNVIGVKQGDDEESAINLDGTPYAVKTDLIPLLDGSRYVRTRYIPDSDFLRDPDSVAPTIPQTGDGMNFALLAAMAAIGMIGMTVIIRKKNEA